MVMNLYVGNGYSAMGCDGCGVGPFAKKRCSGVV